MNADARSLPLILGDDMDALRLLGLSRIPRCQNCPRFAALCAAHDSRMRDGPLPPALPEVPDYCHSAYCAPLAGRHTQDAAA